MHTDWQANDWVIHQRLAKQMDERLHILKTPPQRICIVGADFDISHQLLHARFPKAQLTEWDERPEYLAWSAQARRKKHSMWQKLIGHHTVQIQGSLLTANTPASADLLWANLAFVAQHHPVKLFEHWSHVLQQDGLLFFSHFGPDSLQEIVRFLQQNGIHCAPTRFWDMHDLGDMLFHHGFYDPVMDVERIRLDYQQTERFWRDMAVLSLWPTLNIDATQQTAARELIDLAIAQGDVTTITLEVVFGHAVKKLRLPDNEALVNFYPPKINE